MTCHSACTRVPLGPASTLPSGLRGRSSFPEVQGQPHRPWTPALPELAISPPPECWFLLPQHIRPLSLQTSFPQPRMRSLIASLRKQSRIHTFSDSTPLPVAGRLLVLSSPSFLANSGGEESMLSSSLSTLASLDGGALPTTSAQTFRDLHVLMKHTNGIDCPHSSGAAANSDFATLETPRATEKVNTGSVHFVIIT